MILILSYCCLLVAVKQLSVSVRLHVDGCPCVSRHASTAPHMLSRKLFLSREQRNPTKCDYILFAYTSMPAHVQ